MKPHHVGVILDGGADRARTDGEPLSEAYRRSCVKQLDVVEWCRAEGVAEVTLHVPLAAPLADVQLEAVWGQVLEGLRRGRPGTPATVLNHIGDAARLPAGLATKLRAHAGRAATAGRGFTVNLLLGYEGRHEIRDAVRSILTAAHGEGRSLADTISGLDPERLGAHLVTGALPPLDLVIRTSGRQHLAGFLPWQAAYAEFHFAAVPAPEFARGHLVAALTEYARRNRRFGR
ncbi:undecaprenyl diphosphate synthase family protein [Streptomyces sp. NPDC055078]